jgi:hypothetical protein
MSTPNPLSDTFYDYLLLTSDTETVLNNLEINKEEMPNTHMPSRRPTVCTAVMAIGLLVGH